MLSKKAVYYNVNKNKEQTPSVPPEIPPKKNNNINWSQVSEMLRAIPAGFFQGLFKRNLNYEQWRMERERKKRGLRPGDASDHKYINWLRKIIR